MTDIPSEPGDRDLAEGQAPAPPTDAEWEAFQREVDESSHGSSQAGPGSVPKEPSARARMVAARLRELDEAAARETPRRWGRKQAPEPWRPDGWRTRPTGQNTRRGGRGRWRQSRRVGAAFAVLAVLACALWFADHRGYLDLDAAGFGGVEPADAPPAPTIAGLSVSPPLPESVGHANG